MELTRGAMNTLHNLLQGVGWYKTTKSVYLAGQILTKVLPEPEDVPDTLKRPDGRIIPGAELKGWLEQKLTANFSKAQSKVVVECLEHSLAKKELAPGAILLELLEAFEMDCGKGADE